MSALGDFLELVLGPKPAFRTVRAVIRNWRSGEILSRSADARPIGRRAVGAVEPPQPDVEQTLKVWFAPPHKVRIERVVNGYKGRVEQLTVQNETHTWDRDHEGHVEAGERDDDHPRRSAANCIDVERHFGDSQLREFIQDLSLEAVGTTTCAGRSCVRVRAAPRNGVFWPHWISFGGATYELHLDPERGVALALLAFTAGGELCETHTVKEIAFDEPLDDALFTYEPQRGEQVRKPDPICESMTLAAAAARMPFPVLVPTVPEMAAVPCDAMWHPPRVGGPAPVAELPQRRVPALADGK